MGNRRSRPITHRRVFFYDKLGGIMALKFRQWWQQAVATTIVGSGVYYLMGFVDRHPRSLADIAVFGGSWGITFAAIAWYRSRRRKTAC
jgi:hypothetical protein